jgi:hypothetical protein
MALLYGPSRNLGLSYACSRHLSRRELDQRLPAAIQVDRDCRELVAPRPDKLCGPAVDREIFHDQRALGVGLSDLVGRRPVKELCVGTKSKVPLSGNPGSGIHPMLRLRAWRFCFSTRGSISIVTEGSEVKVGVGVGVSFRLSS